MFIEQQGKCKICGVHQSELKRKFSLDHCHETEMLRGLLCGKCNTGLGMFNDNVKSMIKACIYLNENNGIDTSELKELIE
jgi:hypothetical protein